VEFDLVIRNARVVDGTGALPVPADVGVLGERIEAVGDLAAASAREELDASGQVVCPGFVDVHTHSDWAPFLPDEHAALRLANVLQGVTTEVPGNCGTSRFPILAPSGPGEMLAFPSLREYRAALHEAGMVVNLAPLVGHGTMRTAAMGRDDRAPTPDELATMQRLTEEAMQDGAFGMSTGLALVPGLFAQEQEIITLAGIVGRHGRRYTTHMRDEGDHIERSVAETIEVGRQAGVGVQVSHHKVGPERNWGKSQRTLPMIADAQASGQDVGMDVYPYDCTSNGLAAILPRWFHDATSGTTAERLADPEVRQRLVTALENGETRGASGGRWELVRVASFAPESDYEGLTIAQIAQDRAMSGPETVVDLVAADPGTMIITRGMDLDEVRTIATQPFAMIGSDGVPLPGKPHPRLSGSFATVLSWAEDDAALADVVRRMTSLPCQAFAIPRRGRIERGYVADLVVFDPVTVAPGSTYADPLAPPTGVAHVAVAGSLVVRDGQASDQRPGRVLEPA